MTLRIDRLVLDAPGLDAEGGRRLAERIGAGLAGLTGGRSQTFGRLSVTLSAGASADAQVEAVIAAVRRQTGGTD